VGLEHVSCLQEVASKSIRQARQELRELGVRVGFIEQAGVCEFREVEVVSLALEEQIAYAFDLGESADDNESAQDVIAVLQHLLRLRRQPSFKAEQYI
jgi:hypothetical protein